MDHRRQFMHPLAIIGVVIGVFLHPFPACRHQRPLHRLHGGARHENIEIANEAPLPRGQPRRCIGRAFEHDQRHADRGQGVGRAVRLPQCLPRLPLRIHPGILQDRLHAVRQLHPLDPPCQRGDQSFRLGRRQQAVPARRVQRLDRSRIAQCPHQQGGAHAPPSHRRSTISKAASPVGKSIAQAGTPVTKRVSATKPGSPSAT